LNSLQDNKLGPYLPEALWCCTALEGLGVAGNGLKRIRVAGMLRLQRLR
jgi:hypothetical protein